MSKPQSRKPARSARPARRSIVELTETARRAADDGVLSPVVIAPPSDQPRTAGQTIAYDGTDVSRSSWPGLSRPSAPLSVARKQDVDARDKAGHDESVEPIDQANRSESVERLATCNNPDAGAEGETPELAHRDASRSCKLNASDSSADMAVKIAKAYQAETLDDIKAGFNAALDYAAEFSRRGASSEAAKEPSPDDSGAEKRNALTAQYRAEAARLMTANMATTMDFARRLLGANSSAEWVELTSTHARLQCELMLQQAQALRSLARGMTDSGAGPAAARRSTPQK
jgi:hypothetical protein